MSSNFSDRRAHPRFDATIAVTFRNDGTSATTRDLSVGGCAIVAPRIRLQNERIQIGLLHPGTRAELEVTIEVRRAVPMPDGKYLLGVQFVDVTDELRAKIVKFIEDTKPPAVDEVSKLISAANDAEHGGKIADAIRLLEKALTIDPKRGEALVTRARLASQTGDHRAAASFARRAAEAEPGNQQYAQLYQRFSENAPSKESAPAKGTLQNPAIEPVLQGHRQATKSFIPADPRGRLLAGIGGAVLLAILAGNLWFWILRSPPGGPRHVDPAPYKDLVVMTDLAIRDGRAYGTVDESWPALPDREKRVRDLAAKLRSEGAFSVYLSSRDAKLVATYRDGSARLFK